MRISSSNAGSEESGGCADTSRPLVTDFRKTRKRYCHCRPFRIEIDIISRRATSVLLASHDSVLRADKNSR